MQSKRGSMIESFVGTFIGIITSILTQAIVYPLYGFEVTFSQNIGITAIFTIVSLVRGYLVRRMFCKINNKNG